MHVDMKPALLLIRPRRLVIITLAVTSSVGFTQVPEEGESARQPDLTSKTIFA